ncbi:hypothetical protein [uncultured Caulobacter sp.]|nr:hypothetical protein [uncultured Caulobacter sp.]
MQAARHDTNKDRLATSTATTPADRGWALVFAAALIVILGLGGL